MEVTVELLGIVKRFGSVLANDDVTIRFRRGQIHAVIGENGAGKSTLMNVLYGLHQPDSGEIRIHGSPVSIKDTHDAIALHIGMVHQHFMLSPSLTVLENIVLGQAPGCLGVVNRAAALRSVREVASRYGLDVALNARVRDLSVGAMQRVEILKALYRGAQILILDEPTAVLIPAEVEQLFDILRHLADQDCTVVFISHKLKEVLQVSDRISVMRGGRLEGEVETAATDEQELARLMVGRDVVFRVSKDATTPGRPILRVNGLAAEDNRRLPAIRGIDFEVREGEIVGIAGVEGNGQTELAEVLTGLRPTTGGSIFLREIDITRTSTRRRQRLGIGHIPEDRLAMGADLESTIAENLVLNRYNRPPLSRWGVLNMSAIRGFAGELVGRFNVVAPRVDAPIKELSGGNIQKAILARVLHDEPVLLIAAQPTRGVDVGAIEYIHREIIRLRDQGNGVLLISAELDEIIGLSDRILVMFEGAIAGEMADTEANEQALGLLMTGAAGALPAEAVQ